MKTLLILRHAKSSWDEEHCDDHDRPLNPRGKRDAPRMGEFLRTLELCPDLIISSTAKRARKTASKVAKRCGYPGVIELHGSLYLAPPEEYLTVLSHVDDNHACVLVVGHNPGLEQLLALLTGHPGALPTASLARIELDITHWAALDAATRGRLIALWRPKELDAFEASS